MKSLIRTVSGCLVVLLCGLAVVVLDGLVDDEVSVVVGPGVVVVVVVVVAGLLLL
ncbi:MAG TPA: hypothetical protein VIJ48_11530 [Acidimicrobiia bacterium]